ncbi:hypothetical protein [Lacticaseibacillus nasuensis]|uniref:hypothetical protein n=1 Tax=Lacticaseibacillus nasuensis TaxID=944671 RepID=UPI00224708EA|nr:hypothetical protein [Lacticaseibacillus nasuensis]MCX2456024.1 hypothetical protein [Lacticaseibacillus nasuensis]
MNALNSKRSFAENFTLFQLLIIPIGVAINYVGGNLAIMLKLPLFLDVIGTCFASLVGGPWIGAFTGILTNTMIGITQPMAFMSIHVQIVIALTVAGLVHFGMLSKIWKFALACLILVIFTLCASLPTQIFLLGGVTGSMTDIVTAAVVRAGLPMWAGVAATQFVSNIFDKSASLIIAFLIARSMSPRFLSKLKNGYIFMGMKKKGTTHVKASGTNGDK